MNFAIIIWILGGFFIIAGLYKVVTRFNKVNAGLRKKGQK